MTSTNFDPAEYDYCCKKYGKWSDNGLLRQYTVALVVVPIVLASLIFLGAIYADYTYDIAARINGEILHPHHASAMTGWLLSTIFVAVAVCQLLGCRDRHLKCKRRFERWSEIFWTSCFITVALFIQGLLLAYYAVLPSAIVGLFVLIAVFMRVRLGFATIRSEPAFVLFYVAIFINLVLTGYCFWVTQAL